MPGLGHHAAKAVPSDKSRVGAGVGADLDRSGVRRQQQAAAVPWGCARTTVKTGNACLLPCGSKALGVYCFKH